MNIHEITLDVSKEPAHEPTLYIAQGDKNGTTLVAHMFDNGQVLTLTGKSVAFCMRTPDGLDYYQVAGTVSGNTATFLIDETYAAGHPGITNIAYVVVANGDTEITSSSRIQVVVLPSAKDGVTPAPAYVSLIEAFLNEAQAEIDEAVAAAEAIVDYNVPLMSANQRGGAKLGSGLDVTDEVLSVDITPSDINAYTKTETDDAIAASAARAYKAAGSVTFANLPRTLTASMLGYVYNIEDAFTIDSSVQSIFVEQSGTFPEGTNVVVIDTDTTGTNPTYKYDVIAGFIDLSGYVETSDVINIAHGGTGATTAANAAAAIVDGQAIAPASVTATGSIQGSSISDGTGTLAQLRESVSREVYTDGEFVVWDGYRISDSQPLFRFTYIPSTNKLNINVRTSPTGSWHTASLTMS